MRSNYIKFDKVDGGTPLGRLFNEVFNALELPRGISAPSSSTVNGWNNSEQALLFYEMCLIEEYLHSIIENLTRWKVIAEKYANEFHYSWKYYALSDRIDFIKEEGGEDSDYNDDGSIRTDVSDEELINYTVVNELADPHLNSIFMSTNPMNCLTACFMVVYAGSNCIIDFFKEKTGKTIKTYRMDDYGRMIENDWMDCAIQKAEKEQIHDNVAEMFWSVLMSVYGLVCQVENLPKAEDNKQFFQVLPRIIDAIFNLKIPIQKLPKIDNVKNNI